MVTIQAVILGIALFETMAVALIILVTILEAIVSAKHVTKIMTEQDRAISKNTMKKCVLNHNPLIGNS